LLILAITSGLGIAYLGVALAASIRFQRRQIARSTTLPGVTILKPVHGLEVELFENLSSFCDQDYPDFQVLFGVTRRDDPAIAVIQRVIDRFPASDLRLIIDDRAFTGNPKVANLAGMIAHAKYDLLFVADADMRVDRHYLASVAPEFSDTRVGAATCLYAGVPRGSAASQLAALQLNDQFAPSVLVATLTGQPNFCFGSTMAVRRSALDAIGGIAALAPHLADDYMLGSLVKAQGYRIALARYVVSNVVAEPGLRALVQHELRWARTIRMLQPAGYAFSFVTFPLPFALATVLLGAGSAAAWSIFASVLALRVALHAVMRQSFDRAESPSAWLIPLRDCLGLAVWAAGLFGKTVRWQDRTIVAPSGRISDSSD
jgi:ceramide glucosyltransferase